MPAFREKTIAFYNGEITKKDYKGFSGLYGSYAQKDGKKGMLRLRMTAGRITKEKLAFTAEAIQEHKISRIHFTTCQTVQLHDLQPDTICTLAEEALSSGIVTMGGGGDFPRNVMCSPLSGVESGEYFDVLPYAEAAGEYLMNFIKAPKMPRKLKVGFSNSPANLMQPTVTWDLQQIKTEPLTYTAPEDLETIPALVSRLLNLFRHQRFSTILKPCG